MFGNSQIFLFLSAELERCANRSTQLDPAIYVIRMKQITLLQESLRICLILSTMKTNVCRVTNGAHVFKRPIHSQLNWAILLWCHTWRKNWVKCAVLTSNSAGIRTFFSSRLSHRELRSSLRESHSFLSLHTDTTMASSQGTSFLAIHSADEHRMIYSFSNITSYSIFYAFFSSFRIIWPTWLANSNWQPCF